MRPPVSGTNTSNQLLNQTIVMPSKDQPDASGDVGDSTAATLEGAGDNDASEETVGFVRTLWWDGDARGDDDSAGKHEVRRCSTEKRTGIRHTGRSQYRSAVFASANARTAD
jgi:hypothetical protein